MGETQKVEALRWPIPSSGSPLLCISPELNQSGLLPVQLQAKLDHPLSQGCQTSSGIGLFSKSDHKVVSIAHDDDFTFGLALAPVLDPKVQHVVQEHVGKQR